MKNYLVIIVGFIVSLGIILSKKEQVIPKPISIQKPIIIEKIKPQEIKISVVQPNYLNYDSTVSQLKLWNKEASSITEIGIYGKSTKGKDLYYIKVGTGSTNIMITSCIHGNEPWAASTTMAHIGKMLSLYETNDRIKKLLANYSIYFIPVVSPDSYPQSRFVDNVDPNRNFSGPTRPNHISITPIQYLQKFFLKIKPRSIISGHTYGRVYLYPYGDKYQISPDDSKYRSILQEMGRLSNYDIKRTCNVYPRPIIGTEVDWYYRNGKAFAIVCEFGTHQNIPNAKEIKAECERTWEGVLYFIENAKL